MGVHSHSDARGWRRRRTLTFTVVVGYDEAQHRYYTLESDIPGLNVETKTFDEFMEVTADVAPDLIGSAASGAKIEFRREVALA